MTIMELNWMSVWLCVMREHVPFSLCRGSMSLHPLISQSNSDQACPSIHSQHPNTHPYQPPATRGSSTCCLPCWGQAVTDPPPPWLTFPSPRPAFHVALWPQAGVGHGPRFSPPYRSGIYQQSLLTTRLKGLEQRSCRHNDRYLFIFFFFEAVIPSAVHEDSSEFSEMNE